MWSFEAVIALTIAVALPAVCKVVSKHHLFGKNMLISNLRYFLKLLDIYIYIYIYVYTKNTVTFFSPLH